MEGASDSEVPGPQALTSRPYHMIARAWQLPGVRHCAQMPRTGTRWARPRRRSSLRAGGGEPAGPGPFRPAPPPGPRAAAGLGIGIGRARYAAPGDASGQHRSGTTSWRSCRGCAHGEHRVRVSIHVMLQVFCLRPSPVYMRVCMGVCARELCMRACTHINTRSSTPSRPVCVCACACVHVYICVSLV
jgi:hypothetical protein